MQLLKQNTAFTTIAGPILDSAGAEYTGAVIGDLTITKNGTSAAMAAAATLTHIANGYYTLVGTTGNSDTLGRCDITCNKSTYQMPPVRFSVLAAAPFDTLVTNGTLASTTSGGTLTLSGGKGAATIAAGDLATDSITAAALKADAVTKIAAGIWDALTSGMVQVGSIGKRIVDYLTGDAFTRIGNNGAGLTSLGDTRLANLDAAMSSRAAPGDAMTLTSGERNTIITGIEAELTNDATGEALKQAIVDKIIENLPSLDDLTLAAIAAAVRDVNNTAPTANSLGADLAAAKSSAATAVTQTTANMIRADIGLAAPNLDTQLSTIDDLLDTEVPALTAAVAAVAAYLTTNVGANGANITAAKLHAAGLDAVLIEAAISASVALVNDTGTQLTTINARQAMALILAGAAAKISGAEGATLDLKPTGKPAGASRVIATCDVDGNRTPTVVRVPD